MLLMAAWQWWRHSSNAADGSWQWWQHSSNAADGCMAMVAAALLVE